MNKKTKLVVKTDVGTFTRTTARTYTHVVVAKGVRHELLEAERQAAIAEARKRLREYEAILAGNKTIGIRTSHPVSQAWDIECRDKSLADGSYLRYAADQRARIAALEAQGPITEDQGDKWALLGWCGRPDLAFKKVNEKGRVHYYDSASRYREARAYALDGTRAF